LFEKEVVGKPGSTKDSSNGDSDISSFDYTEYRRLYSSWHAKLGASLIGCLKSSEYIHTRTALIILSRIVSCYPTKPKLGDKLLMVLKPLQDDVSKPDIQAQALSYGGGLTKIRDDVDVHAYYHKETDSKVFQEHADKKLKEEELKREEAEKKSLEMKEENDRISRDMYRSDYSGRRPGGGRGGGRNRDGGGRFGPPTDHHHHNRSGKDHPSQQALPPMQQQPSRNYRGDNRGTYFNPQRPPPPPPASGIEGRWQMPASDAGPASSKRPLPDAASGNNPDHASFKRTKPPPPPPPSNNPKGRWPGGGQRR